MNQPPPMDPALAAFTLYNNVINQTRIELGKENNAQIPPLVFRNIFSNWSQRILLHDLPEDRAEMKKAHAHRSEMWELSKKYILEYETEKQFNQIQMVNNAPVQRTASVIARIYDDQEGPLFINHGQYDNYSQYQRDIVNAGGTVKRPAKAGDITDPDDLFAQFSMGRVKRVNLRQLEEEARPRDEKVVIKTEAAAPVIETAPIKEEPNTFQSQPPQQSQQSQQQLLQSPQAKGPLQSPPLQSPTPTTASIPKSVLVTSPTPRQTTPISTIPPSLGLGNRAAIPIGLPGSSLMTLTTAPQPTVGLPKPIGMPGMPSSNIGMPGMPSSTLSMPGMPSSNIGMPGMPSSTLSLPGMPSSTHGMPASTASMPSMLSSSTVGMPGMQRALPLTTTCVRLTSSTPGLSALSTAAPHNTAIAQPMSATNFAPKPLQMMTPTIAPTSSSNLSHPLTRPSITAPSITSQPLATSQVTSPTISSASQRKPNELVSLSTTTPDVVTDLEEQYRKYNINYQFPPDVVTASDMAVLTTEWLQELQLQFWDDTLPTHHDRLVGKDVSKFINPLAYETEEEKNQKMVFPVTVSLASIGPMTKQLVPSSHVTQRYAGKKGKAIKSPPKRTPSKKNPTAASRSTRGRKSNIIVDSTDDDSDNDEEAEVPPEDNEVLQHHVNIAYNDPSTGSTPSTPRAKKSKKNQTTTWQLELKNCILRVQYDELFFHKLYVTVYRPE